MVANAEPLGLALQRRAVGLAVFANDGRVRRPDDEVDEVGTGRDSRRQRPDHRLDALAWSEQPERQQHAVTGDAELGLERVLVARRHVGDAVRDDVDLRARQRIAAREQIGGHLAHDDEPRGLGHLLHDASLRVRGIVEHRVQGDDRRDAQRAQEVEDVRAVVAAEDAVFVLQRHPAHVLVVDQLGGARVVALRSLPYLVADLVRVLVVAGGVRHRDRHRLDARAGGVDAGREIAGERRDAATARRIGPDERYPKVCSQRAAPSRPFHGVLPRRGPPGRYAGRSSSSPLRNRLLCTRITLPRSEAQATVRGCGLNIQRWRRGARAGRRPRTTAA